MRTDDGRHDRMAAMYRRGVSMPDIAAQFGVNPPAVRTALVRMGVHTPTPRTHRDTLKASLAEHMANGGTLETWAPPGAPNLSGVRKLWAAICADVGESEQ